MPIPVFYAMTKEEMQSAAQFPEHLALIDFANGTEDSLLILTDRKSWSLSEIQSIANNHSKILLDFQHPENPENHRIIAELERLGLPYCATGIYAAQYGCAVLLPPVPPTRSLSDHISPWKGRELWLEIALDGQHITLTKDGCTEQYIPHAQHRHGAHNDEKLHCRYFVHTTENAAEFTLWRSKEDIADLLKEAESLGVRLAVGLWQEWK